MSAAFFDAVFPDHDDLISIADGGQTVGDGDAGPVFGEFFQAFLNVALAFVVERAGGFIKDQDLRILQEYPCLEVNTMKFRG